MKELHGRVAVVTGGGSGIGRATSLGLAREGCDVAVVDLNAANAEETARLVRESGRRASVHVANVADKARMAALPAEVKAEHGKVEIVVNNAGVTVARTFEDHSLEDLEWIVGINFWGVVYGCKFFLPLLAGRDEAHIVNVSSMAGLLGLPMQSSYCATKFAVRGFSESLTAELAGSSVGVTAIFPGSIRTQVLRSSRRSENGTVDRLADLLERHARPPSVVADRIVTAIRKNQPRVIIGAEAHLTDWLRRATPDGASSLLAWGFGKARSRL
jgi:NAD(P)-dependent dehydrogenase (short-subunit alcohol dehydrogenase family)